jgi:hypothetical protein
MAEPIKSVLLVDYESLQRSLVGTVGETRLAERSAAWLAALEAGRLGPDVKRKLMVKRCYAGPSLRGKQRDLIIAAGFELVDSVDAGARSSADLHMAMDTIDALAKPEGYQEFILLSAAAELAPLISRLKANKRVTVIYADPATPSGDRNLADATIETSDLVRVLTGEPTSVGDISVPAGAPSPRADIEAFARRIHAATSIPLFSPKTFAELFRQLTEEISTNGYHFQTTARNVADRMVAGGRNVTRRQVVFIVKGLALKGHVFSTSDTAEKLAEVFREQAHYLITNAGITLNRHEEDLLTAWFLSRAPSAAGASAPLPAATAPAPRPAAAAPPPAPPATATVPEPSPDAKAAIAETIEREVAKAVARQPSQADRVPIKPPQPQQPQPQPTRPNAAQPQKPPQVKVELPKSTARPPPFPSAREEAKAVIAARIAGAARMKPAGTRTPIPAKPAPKAPAPPPPPEEPEAPPVAAAAPPLPADGGESDALENSILAAIAEAVDVLVEDSNEEHQEPEPPPPPPQREPQGKKRATNQPPPPRRPEPEPLPAAEEDEPAESNDIGDQIQRIIASYNRNRSDE